MTTHAQELSAGKRFAFGKNWRSFLSVLDADRIATAEASLCAMLECAHLAGKRFLDVGSGSGLFSLAARRLGAHVHSFDYDPLSVACTRELKHRFFPGDRNWTIEEGSILDRQYIESLGRFDVVYAWGVLQLTGDMWRALEHAQIPVGDQGSLFVAVSNDQGARSRLWKKVKATYCSGSPGKAFVCGLFIPLFVVRCLVHDVKRLQNPVRSYTDYRKKRGMSRFHDWMDWLGGYPFEVAKAETLLRFYEGRNFTVSKAATVTGNGCHQFVFKRKAAEKRRPNAA